ncbi:MAG: N-acetyltransferase [Rhodobacteraceae bacterium]|nr:MAG: N-acetyltransferase [Paracoccaceae bacterium]
MLAFRPGSENDHMPQSAPLKLRPAQIGADDDALWAMLQPVFRAGDTYAMDPDIDRDAALAWWQGGAHRAHVAHRGAELLGSYYICPNQQGGGAHVCNCGFVTAPAAQGQGVARAMVSDALREARAQGYLAMQFNCVVSTNTRAVALWQTNGFEIVGRLPEAFRHPQAGFIDAFVMYRKL